VLERVAGDLVALGRHASDHVRVGGLPDVAKVEPVDEKRALDPVPPEKVEQLAGVNVRAVVKSDGHGAGNVTSGDLDTCLACQGGRTVLAWKKERSPYGIEPN
jgi:hypothetical protein